jgi:hypothetical protein
MISTDAKNKIINKLSEYNIICNRFMSVVDIRESYPEYIISASLDGKKITLHLISCVHDKKANILGIKVVPDSDRKDEVLSFSVSVAPDDLYAINDHITNKYIEKELLEVDKINNDFPFKVDYQVALFYEFFCFVTGTLVYNKNAYEIMTLSEYPTCMVGAYAHDSTAKFYSKGKILLKFNKNGINFTYNNVVIPCDYIEKLRLKIFQELLFYYMDKTSFKMNIMGRDELILLSYDDLLRSINVQQMVDI